MAKSAGDKRRKKALRRKSRQGRREARNTGSGPEHWDRRFGQAVRFAMAHLQADEDVVAYLARGRLPSGVRVLKAFLDELEPDPAEERVLRGWTALQATLLECLENRGTTLLLRDLVTGVEHTARVANPAAVLAFERVPYGAGILLPTPDGPVIGGEIRGVRENAGRREVLAVAANLCRQQPILGQRAHPEALATMLAQEHAAFVERFGGAYVEVEPGGLSDALEKLATYEPSAVDGLVVVSSLQIPDVDGPVGMLHDERHGLLFLSGLGSLLDDPSNVDRVGNLWHDPRVCPAVFDLLASRSPDVLDATLSSVFGRTVRWSSDRDALVQQMKPRWRRPRPHIVPMPEDVAAAFDPRTPPDGTGMLALLGLVV